MSSKFSFGVGCFGFGSLLCARLGLFGESTLYLNKDCKIIKEKNLILFNQLWIYNMEGKFKYSPKFVIRPYNIEYL